MDADKVWEHINTVLAMNRYYPIGSVHDGTIYIAGNEDAIKAVTPINGRNEIVNIPIENFINAVSIYEVKSGIHHNNGVWVIKPLEV